MDVRNGSPTWIVKIQYGADDVTGLRFTDFASAIEFMQVIGEYFQKEAQLSIMSEAQFIQIANERNHPEWINNVEDADTLEDTSDF